MSLDNIPPELKNLDQWVVWRTENRDGKPTKIPYDPNTGEKASSTDPKTWSSWEKAEAIVKGPANIKKAKDKRWGIGFVFSESDPYVGIDLDDCVENGVIHPEAEKLLDGFGTYKELSPSQTGVKLIGVGEKPSQERSRGKGPWGGEVEIYDRGRFFALTGQLIGGAKNTWNINPELTTLYHNLFPAREKTVPKQRSITESMSDAVVMEKMFSAPNGNDISYLWSGGTGQHGGDESRRDIALMAHLAWWTNGDREQMERLFGESECGRRDKWLNRADYRERTIESVMETFAGGYTPFVQGEEIELNKGGIPGEKTEPVRDRELPPVLTVAELLLIAASPDKKFKWIAEGLIQEKGITVLASPSGVGKTWVALYLCNKLTEDGDKVWLRDFELPMKRVLYMDEENGDDTIADRVSQLGFNGENPNFLAWCDTGLKLDSPGDRKIMVAKCLEIGADYIVFDSLVAFHTKDENNSTEMRKIGQSLRDSFVRNGISVLALHHDRKGGQGDVLGAEQDKTRGSGDITAFSQTVLGLSEKDGIYHISKRKIRGAKNDRKLISFAMYEDESGKMVFSVDEGEKRDNDRKEQAEYEKEKKYVVKIVDAIKELAAENQPVTNRAIAQKTRISLREVGNYRQQAEDKMALPASLDF